MPAQTSLYSIQNNTSRNIHACGFDCYTCADAQSLSRYGLDVRILFDCFFYLFLLLRRSKMACFVMKGSQSVRVCEECVQLCL